MGPFSDLYVAARRKEAGWRTYNRAGLHIYTRKPARIYVQPGEGKEGRARGGGPVVDATGTVALKTKGAAGGSAYSAGVEGEEEAPLEGPAPRFLLRGRLLRGLREAAGWP